jgi:predicted transcriptional regulator of viral defense system
MTLRKSLLQILAKRKRKPIRIIRLMHTKELRYFEPSSIASTVTLLCREGMLMRLKRGYYVITREQPETTQANVRA